METHFFKRNNSSAYITCTYCFFWGGKLYSDMCIHTNYKEFGYINIQTIGQLDINSFLWISTRCAPELNLEKKYEIWISAFSSSWKILTNIFEISVVCLLINTGKLFILVTCSRKAQFLTSNNLEKFSEIFFFKFFFECSRS